MSLIRTSSLLLLTPIYLLKKRVFIYFIIVAQEFERKCCFPYTRIWYIMVDQVYNTWESLLHGNMNTSFVWNVMCSPKSTIFLFSLSLSLSLFNVGQLSRSNGVIYIFSLLLLWRKENTQLERRRQKDGFYNEWRKRRVQLFE